MPAAPPTLDSVDADLADLREATSAVAMTLMALDGDTTRTALDRAQGRTAARWQQPSADLAAAWATYPQLSACVDALIELRGSDRRPGRDTVARLGAALYAGIDLVAGGADAAACARLADAAGDGPAAPGAVRPEPARLAAALRRLLAGVSDLLAEVRRVQGELLPRAEASVRALAELRGAVDGVADSATGQAVVARLDSLTGTLAADPLSLSPADFDAVDDAIAAVHASVTSAEALREHLVERLAAGRALLAGLPALLAEARAAHDLAAVKILDGWAGPAAPAAAVPRGQAAAAGAGPAGVGPRGPDPLPTAAATGAGPGAPAPFSAAAAAGPAGAGPGRPDPLPPAAAAGPAGAGPGGPDPSPTAGDLRALAAELAALDALAAAGQWRALAARRPAWSAGVHAVADRATAVRDRCRTLLAHRDELRGRLGAYRAKAQAYGLAEDAELSRLAELAHGTLSIAPCDLTAADVQVGAYAAAVRAATAATRPATGRATGPS